MAATIDATVGSADANSYATMAEAVAYFDARIGSAAWDDANTTDRTKVLLSATARLEQESYAGSRVDDTQALAWPRTGLVRDGVVIPSTSVPAFVKRAQFEEAYELLDNPDKYAPTGLEAFDAARVGSISVDLRQGVNTPARLSASARRELQGMILPGAGSGQFTVTRA